MRRPSLTKRRAEALAVALEEVRCALARETDRRRRRQLADATDFLEETIAYKREGDGA